MKMIEGTSRYIFVVYELLTYFDRSKVLIIQYWLVKCISFRIHMAVTKILHMVHFDNPDGCPTKAEPSGVHIAGHHLTEKPALYIHDLSRPSAHRD